MQEERPVPSDANVRWEAAALDLPPFPRPLSVVAPAPPVRYAGYLVRAMALGIDVAVLSAFAVPLALAGLAGIQAGMLALGQPASMLGAAEIMTSLVSPAWGTMALVYFTALHRGDGRTIGKAAVGIRVRSVDLEAIGTVRSLVRALGYLLSSMLFGLGFMIAALSPRKRAGHDYLAGTCVVHLAPEEA